MSNDTPTAPESSSVYRLVVRSADEAVQTIRERFGSAAKVLSVKQVEGQGIVGLFTRPKLEVVVQVGVQDNGIPASFVGSQAGAAPTQSQESTQPASAQSQGNQTETRDTAGLPADPAGMARIVENPASFEIRRSKSEPLSSVDLPDLLRRSGFSETFLARLRAMPSWSERDSKPLHVTLVDLGNDLRKMFANRKLRPLPARTAFIGTMGVGRTTALCKWLGSEVFGRGRSGRVLKVEFDRPNPAEHLAIYCEALGLSLEHYSPDTNLSVNQDEFLYVDLPGFEFRRPMANHQLANFLNTSKFEGRVLVLNALYDHSTLRSAYAAGRELGATHLVFTHCDELVHWGKLMDFLMDGDLSPLFLATGPSLSGDCVEDCFSAVLHKTIPGA